LQSRKIAIVERFHEFKIGRSDYLHVDMV